MKKEVKVKTYTRKTKSGKSVIVRAHTSKRDSGTGVAESATKATKKKGAGEEFEALLQQARKNLSPERQAELFESISSTIKEHLAVKEYEGMSLAQSRIMSKNPNIQKAINKGWRLLKPLKGDSKVVLAAPKGYKVRAYGESGPGDYVWGAVGEDGSYARPTNSMDRYAARQWYEKQAKELNKGTKKKK